MQRPAARIIAVVLALCLIVPPAQVLAAFNKNFVLADNDLLDERGFSRLSIQRFLEGKDAGISRMSFEALGSQKRASDIIYDAAQYWRVNPKYLLVRLQVEQSLVTTTSPTQRQLDFATGYGCPDGSGCASGTKGFFNQVNWAAKILQSTDLDRYGRPKGYLTRIATTGTTISGWGPGITKTTLDGITVTPVNAATAALYTYTPWVGKYGGGIQAYGGTSLVWKTWTEWFTRKFPNGTLLRPSDGVGIYLIQDGKKRPFWSRSAFFANYDPDHVITVSPTDLDPYESGSPIKYAPFTLIQAPNGAVFLVVRGKRRGIPSREVFRQIGFNPEEVIPTTWEDIESIPEGRPIAEDSLYPTGALLQSRTTGGIMYVENGVRHAILSKEILLSRFRNRPVTVVDDESFRQYRLGSPIKFREGELVTASGTRSVYVISNGTKRAIDSQVTFEALGYRWENIRRTTDQALALHPTGTPITLD